jgi:hypothetical protein
MHSLFSAFGWNYLDAELSARTRKAHSSRLTYCRRSVHSDYDGWFSFLSGFIEEYPANTRKPGKYRDRLDRRGSIRCVDSQRSSPPLPLQRPQQSRIENGCKWSCAYPRTESGKVLSRDQGHRFQIQPSKHQSSSTEDGQCPSQTTAPAHVRCRRCNRCAGRNTGNLCMYKPRHADAFSLPYDWSWRKTRSTAIVLSTLFSRPRTVPLPFHPILLNAADRGSGPASSNKRISIFDSIANASVLFHQDANNACKIALPVYSRRRATICCFT